MNSLLISALAFSVGVAGLVALLYVCQGDIEW